MTLAAGTKLGPYEIQSPLGAGGMGEVYRARDTRLNRIVAIKILPTALATDADRLQRFEHEALVLSALNHPNLLSIYDVGTQGGTHYLVSEFLEGQTLRDRIGYSPLPLRKVIDYALQIATGLSAAHDKGIVHRDLKPENVFVTRDERVKILDFGLAKQTDAAAFATDGATVTGRMQTAAGVVLGTVGYMSPEQVRAQPTDHRSDIFSFGAILYEMVSGKRAFKGESSIETMNAIIKEDPPELTESSAYVSPGLERIIHRCMEKAPERRFQSASDLAFAIEALSGTSSSKTGQMAIVAPARFPHRAVWITAASVLIAAVIVFAGGVAYWRSRTPKVVGNDTVVLADFTNTTGDSVFDGTLKQALAIQLEQSPFLHVLSDSRVNSTLKLMSRAPGERLTNELAREVCVRTNSKALLEGSILNSGGHYDISVKALDCQTGDTLASARTSANTRDTVLKEVGEAANQIREKLGESLASVQRYNKPLEQATTSSLEALKAFSDGRKAQWEGGNAASIPFHKHAVELDPNFARAYASLGMAYSNLGESGSAIENFRKAFELRDRVSERERYYIEASYYSFATGELEKANQSYRAWSEAYPDDYVPYGNLPLNYFSLGEFQKAADSARQSIRLNPGSMVGYSNLMNAYVSLDRMDEAKAIYDEAITKNPDADFLHELRYYLGFLQNDEAAMQQQVEWAQGKAIPGAELLFAQSETAAYRGELSKARELSHQAEQEARRADATETAALYMATAAAREAEFGNAQRARQLAKDALGISSGRDETAVAAIALARAGDTAAAQGLAHKLDQQFPLDTIMQNYWLPTIRASIALQGGNAQQAIAALEVALPYELGNQGSERMHPIYVRGLAYLKAKRGEEAAAEFKKMLSHRGLAQNSPLEALAQLQLARAEVLSGETKVARLAYQDFLALWKNADADLPLLKEAKAEYDKLP